MDRYINGIKVGSNTKDITGKRFDRLVVIELVGRHETRHNAPLLWRCLCDCGEKIEAVSSDLMSGHKKSCGCLLREVKEASKESFKQKYETHGLSGTREHKAWKGIKQRCLNKNNKDYEIYSKIGIGEDIADDFIKFLDTIGMIPESMPGKVSVDRINNNIGYVVGNLRWATDEQQARNKGKYKNNQSGITGVRFHIGANGCTFWCASWYKEKGKQSSKYFSINKYGDELARFLAEEYRQYQIELLNLRGAGYSENHGKEKENK